MKLKYTMHSNGHWFYQRRYPTDLLSHPQINSPLFRKSLALTITAPEEDLLAAWKQVHLAFEQFVEALRATHTEATGRHGQCASMDTIKVPEPSSPHRIRRATLLTDCWAHYEEFKQIDLQSREGKRIKRRWDYFIKVAGDSVLSYEGVHEALDRYVESRLGRAKGSSISRELNQVLAILRYTTRKLRIPVGITKPPVPSANVSADRYVLKEDEEIALLHRINDPGLAGWKRASLLLMLESGCTTSELQRLSPNNIHLSDSIPYIVLKNERMKTNSRPRVIVPVVNVGLLREHMPLPEKFRGMSESNASHQLKTVLRKVAPNATPYSLRHGTRNRAIATGVDFGTQALIGGWSNGLNVVQLGYGRTGVTQQNVLMHLKQAMEKMNAHLITAQTAQ